jgi:glutathione synthase
MSASAYSDYPPQLTPGQREYLIKHLKDWSIAHGLAVRPSPTLVDDPAGVLATTAPVTLFPSPFPRSCFEEAISIQPAYNELYSGISRDEEWLGEIVKEYDPTRY